MIEPIESKSEDHISTSRVSQIVVTWHQGKGPGQIAGETGIPVEVVYMCLKQVQKLLVSDGVKHHGKKNKF